MKIRAYLFLIIIGFFFIACDKKENIKIEKQSGNGVFIVNEGNFSWGNASLSFYNIDSNKIYNDVFFEANGAPLGDVAQSMGIIDSVGYIVVNNSGKIYAINTSNYKYIGKITGLTSPRYIQIISKSKAYVSDLYDKSIAIINPLSLTIIGHITANHTTEKMIMLDSLVFATCWSKDNKVIVVNSNLDQCIDSIAVGNQPNSLVLDKNKKLWVLCDGGFQGGTIPKEKATLMRINTGNFEIEQTLTFQNIGDSPTELNINTSGDTLYFINKDVYRMSIESNNLPLNSLIAANGKLFYGLAINSLKSNLFISDAVDYLQQGFVYRYNLNGELISSFKTGVIPGAFCFSSN